MRKVFYLSCVITIAISLIYFDFIEISIGQDKEELETEIRTMNNSVVETLKYFSQNDNDQIFNSKIIILNFWYPTCGPCIREIPILNEIQDEFKNEAISFLSYCPESLYEFSTNNKTTKEIKVNFNYQPISFNSGVKKSIQKIALNKGLIDSEWGSFPNTVILSTSNDSILYFTQADIKKSDLPEIYIILENELDKKY